MSRKVKALLIGSSYSAAPILDRIRHHGIDVAVCGNLQQDPCHRYADESYLIDYSNRDALLELVRNFHFDFLVPSCNDVSYMSGAWVAQQTGHLGFDNYSVAKIFHNKDVFREVARRLELPIPRAVQIRRDEMPVIPEDWYPLLIKPVDSFSGQGITKIDDAVNLSAAIEHALGTSRSVRAVAEEFIDGTLHSHSAFIADGAIVQDFFVDEFCTVYPYQVDCSNHPSSLPGQLCDEVRRSIEKLIHHLAIADGLLHTQFISNKGRHWIIETMRRAPGDLYGGLIERSLGVDYTEQYVAGFIGRKPGRMAVGKSKFMGRHTVSVPKECTVHSLSYQFPGRWSSIVSLKESGMVLRPAPHDKLAIIFNEFQSREEMLAITHRLKEFVKICSLDGRVEWAREEQ